MAKTGYDTLYSGEKRFYTFKEGKNHKISDLQFEPVMFSRDIDKISEDRYQELLKMAELVKYRMAFDKNVPISVIDKFDIDYKYSYALRLILNNNIENIKFKNNQRLDIQSDAEKHLLIALVADKDCVYYKSYEVLKNDGKTNQEIKDILIDTCGFYSHKFLLLELQYQKLSLILEANRLEDEIDLRKQDTTKSN